MRHWKIGAVAVIVLAACGIAIFALQIVRFGGHVPMPARNASPERVVRTYIDALNKHDCATAVALWSDPSTPSIWCDQVSSVKARVLGQFSEASPASQRDGSVDVTVDWRPFHNDGSLPPKFGWKFLLRNSAAGWRIYDEGQG